MARHKRMEFKQPGRTGRRGGVPQSLDRVFISRRMLVARTAIVGGFTALASRLGYMQIVAHDDAVADARGNTQYTKMLPAPRGLIYDRQGRLLARNETAFQVEIVPADLPSLRTAKAERRRVLDRLIAELKLPDALVIDPNDIPTEQKDEVYASIARARAREGEDIAASVEAIKEAEDQNYLILLEDDLSIDDAAKWRLKCRSTPGLKVMNLLDYQLGNTSSTSQNPVIVKTGVGRETAMSIEANKLYLPGVRIDGSVLVRRYPGGPSMSHILGFVGPVSEAELETSVNQAGNPIYASNDRSGKDGLEAQLEETLRGQKGYQKTLRDAIGNDVGIVPGTEDFNQEASPGDSVTLTIDLELQTAASRALKSYIEHSTDDRKAKGNDKNKQWSNSGAVVALDPRNGEVLAMVSYPQFDNELLTEGISGALWEELGDEKSGRPYFNRAIGSAQPPGSTFKSFLAAAALYEGTLQPESTFVCTGGLGIELAGDASRKNAHPCWNTAGHGAVDLDDAIKTSCDVYFYNVGTGTVEDLVYYEMEPETGATRNPIYGTEAKPFTGLGIDRIHRDMTEKFWFGAGTGFALGGEAEGLIPSQQWLMDTQGEGWSAGQTIIASIGQGFTQTTPIQMAANTVALANGGTVYKPVVVRNTIKSATNSAGTAVAEAATEPEIVPAEPQEPLRRIDFNEGNLEAVRQGMANVIEGFVGQSDKLNGSVSYATLDVDGAQVQDPEWAWPRTNPPGTAKKDRIRIAGKTGTAEVEATDVNIADKDDNGKYNNQHAWFTCWAPFEEPEIVVSVLLEYGGEGSAYAAPCADAILRAYFETTGRRSRNQTVEFRGERRTVSVLREDKEPVLDIETAESLTFFKPTDTADTSGTVD